MPGIQHLLLPKASGQAELGGGAVRQAVQVEDFDAHGGLFNGSGYVVHDVTVPADGRDGAH